MSWLSSLGFCIVEVGFRFHVQGVVVLSGFGTRGGAWCGRLGRKGMSGGVYTCSYGRVQVLFLCFGFVLATSTRQGTRIRVSMVQGNSCRPHNLRNFKGAVV